MRRANSQMVHQPDKKQIIDAIIAAKLSNSKGNPTPKSSYSEYDTVFYIRQSCSKQASIPKQKETLIKWADEMGWRYDLELSFFSDVKSGGNADRKGYKELVEDITTSDRKRLVILSSSRPARSTLISAQLEELLRNKEMELWIWEEKHQFNLHNKADRMHLGFKSLIDEATRREIIRTTKWGMYRNAQKGYWQSGKPPYGYLCKDKKHLIIDTEKAPIVRRIFRELETRTYSQVMMGLNSNHIPSPKGKKWTIGTIAKIVHNRVYLGEINFGDAKPARDAHAPIISIEQWEEVHNSIKSRWTSKTNKDKNKKKPAIGISNRDPQHIALYSTLLYCGICGNPMKKVKRIRRNKNGSIKTYLWYDCGTPDCPNRYSPLVRIEEAIFRYLSRITQDKQYFNSLLEDYWQRLKRTNYEEKLAEINRNIAESQERIKFVEKTWGNRIKNDELPRKAIKQHQGKIQTLIAEKSRIESILEFLKDKKNMRKRFYKILRQPARNWHSMDSREKIHFIRKIFEKIIYTGKNKISFQFR